MTNNEVRLIKLIRDCTYPDKALVVAIRTILSFLEQH